MNLDKIRKDVKSIMEIGVDERVNKLFAAHSEDEATKCLALIKRTVSMFNLYCDFFVYQNKE